MPDDLASGSHRRTLVPEVPIGVDLHLDPAIGIDRLGHHGDEIDPLHIAADDEGGGLVIGIGGARAHATDEHIIPAQNLSIPFRFQERSDLSSGPHPTVKYGQGVATHDLAVLVGIAVTSPDLARRNVAHHRAGIAADLFFAGALTHSLASRIAASTQCGKAGRRVTSAPVAWRIAFRIAGAVGIKTCSPSPLAPIGPSGSVTSSRIVSICGMSPVVGIRSSCRFSV